MPLSWLAGVGGVLLGAVHALAYPFVAPALRKYCLPYVAANAQQLSLVARVCEARQIRNVVDLGSGDGIVCVELARTLGIRARGVELNPWLTFYARLSARLSNVSMLATFHIEDLFDAKISDADAVVLFVVPAMAADIEKKLANELHPDSFVLSGRFPLKTWTPIEHLVHSSASSGYNINQLWVYQPRRSIPAQ